MTDTRDPAPAAFPPASRGWMLAGLLALASIMSQFDRTVINLAVEPIKADFGLNDTQFGMLQGVAFGIFYTLACLPLGRLADRYQRRLILGICLLVFSLFSMASGLSRTYWQLFLTRVGVGIGEASVTPAGMSMLSDSFPPDRLGRPISVFLMSAPVGQGLAFILGGSLLGWLGTSGVLDAGLMAGLEAWQAAFILIGAPGLLLVPIFLLMREPARLGPQSAEPLPVAEVWRVIRDRAGALVPMFAGFSMVSLVVYAFFIWTPAFFGRTYGWTPAEVGLAFGLLLFTCATSGAFFAGWMSDRLAQRGVLDAPLKVAALGFVGCGVFGAIAPLVDDPWLCLALLAPTLFLANMPFPCAGTAIQLIIPNRARAQVTGLYIMLTSLVGLTLGPLIVGLMTDQLFQRPEDIRYSLAITVGVPPFLMFALLTFARPRYRRLRAGGAA